MDDNHQRLTNLPIVKKAHKSDGADQIPKSLKNDKSGSN